MNTKDTTTVFILIFEATHISAYVTASGNFVNTD